MGLWEDIEEHGPKSNLYGDKFDSYDDFLRREKYVKGYGWAVPDRKSIEKIKQFVGNDQVLEIGSGLGTWAKLLQDEGIYVTPTDISVENSHTEVYEENHINSINTFNNHTVLMMVWPPYDSPMATEALKAFKGNKLIYVGEGHGGCTGNDCFFDILYDNWELIEKVHIKQWYGLHDSLYLYVRK